MAITTTNSVKRNINVLDGIVDSLGISGTNTASGNWEADEKLAGKNDSINWFLSWDDSTLFIGKVGGRNTDGSLIFIHADYANAKQDSQSVVYDGFHPDFSLMSGINFNCYLSKTYDEFRTFNGSWNSPDTSLSPYFSNQSNGDNMELAIPWKVISNGNGKPTNIKIVFYQVDTSMATCPLSNSFLYAESPWGNGNAPIEPTTSVNDGLVSSTAQPHNCATLSDTVTRWWGNFPTIGNVLVNKFIVTEPNAGKNNSICLLHDSIKLSGNKPNENVSISWSIGTKPSASNPKIISPTSNETVVDSLIIPGLYQFVYSFDYGTRFSKPDTISITVYAPIKATLPSQLFTCSDTLQLMANNPANVQYSAFGNWSVLSGMSLATITNDTLYNSTITNLKAGNYALQWKVGNGNCPEDSIITHVKVYPKIDAGSDSLISICNQNLISLNGVNPTAIDSSVIGEWSVVSGLATINSKNNYNSIVSNLPIGSSKFQWKLSNGVCKSDSAIVTVFNYAQPYSFAGNDTLTCDSSFSLHANNVALIQDSAVGFWKVLSGPSGAVFSSISNPSATILFAKAEGKYLLQWTVNNGVCLADSDTLNLTVSKVISISTVGQIELCNTDTVTLSANSSSTAKFKWEIISGNSALTFANAANNKTLLSGLDYGTSIVSVNAEGLCNIDNEIVSVINYRLPTATTSNDLLICSDTVSLIANNPTEIQPSAKGVWKEVSGKSGFKIDNINSSHTIVSSLKAGEYFFNWIVTNGVCPSVKSDIIIKVSNGFDFGKITYTNSDYDKSNGVIVLQESPNAFPPIWYSIDGNNYETSLIFDSLFVGSHILKAKDSANCERSISIIIEPKLFIPSGISPNNDGVNDEWVILQIEKYTDAEINIYTSWGEKIFGTKSNKQLFDGTFNGKQLPEGNYYYTIDLKDESNPLKGKLTILR